MNVISSRDTEMALPLGSLLSGPAFQKPLLTITQVEPVENSLAGFLAASTRCRTHGLISPAGAAASNYVFLSQKLSPVLNLSIPQRLRRGRNHIPSLSQHRGMRVQHAWKLPGYATRFCKFCLGSQLICKEGCDTQISRARKWHMPKNH